MEELYIYGCGGVGNELAELLSNDSRYELKGFVDDNPAIKECMGLRSWTLDELLRERRPNEICAVISIGEPAIRRIVSARLASKGIREVLVDFSNHFNASFSTVGEGTLLHLDSYVSVNARIGKTCLINKGVLVAHDCVIGAYSVLSPRVVLGGNVSVGEETFIGTGALVRNGVSIGSRAIVGMGAVVVKDVEDDAVVVGNPARFVRKNESNRVFKHR